MNLVIQLIITTLAVLVTSYLLPGVHVEDPYTAVVVALVLSLLNVFLKPLLILFALPAVLFSFGLFLIVINAFIILLADHLINGFEVQSLGWAFLFSVVMWLVTSIFNSIKTKDEQAE